MSLRSVFRKPPDNICWWFVYHFETNLKHIWPWRDPGRFPGTTLGHLWTQTSKKYTNIKKTFFLYLVLGTFVHRVLVIFFAFLNCVLGNPPNHFLRDLKTCWNNLWSSFPDFLKILETLKNAGSPMRNQSLWVSRALNFHHFSKHFSRQVLVPAFYHFLIDF